MVEISENNPHILIVIIASDSPFPASHLLIHASYLELADSPAKPAYTLVTKNVSWRENNEYN